MFFQHDVFEAPWDMRLEEAKQNEILSQKKIKSLQDPGRGNADKDQNINYWKLDLIRLVQRPALRQMETTAESRKK